MNAAVGGQELEHVGILEEISVRGASVQMEHSVPLDTNVRLICNGCQFRGKVRNCVFHEGLGYYAGVQFADEVEWAKESYRPQHMINTEHFVILNNVDEGRYCDAVDHECPGERAQKNLPTDVGVAHRVRAVASEVAKICAGLDESSMEACFSRLFQIPAGCELYHEFSKEYIAHRKQLADVNGKTSQVLESAELIAKLLPAPVPKQDRSQLKQWTGARKVTGGRRRAARSSVATE